MNVEQQYPSVDPDDVDGEVDISGSPRGAVLPSPGKQRITIRIDIDVLDWFRDQAEAAVGGSYQAMINSALRDCVAARREPLEATLRRVVREEFGRYEIWRDGDDLR